jgi:alpha-L-fucosidase
MKNHLKTLCFAAVVLFCTAVFSPFISAKPKKIACIGNSITYGVGIKDRDRYSYPAQLARMLGAEWDVKNFGVSGATILKKGNYPYWNRSEFGAVLAYQPDVVIIKLGTNDSKPENWKHKGDFVKDYSDFVETFSRLNSHPRIYLCAPVPAFPGDWGIRDSVIKNGVIPMVREIASKHKLEVIDLYSPFLGKPDLFPDKVHPNAEGARAMAEIVYGVLCKDYSLIKAPDPLVPVPTVRQLAWQEMEYYGFLHFNMNTFTDKEWGYGDEPESLFHPTAFDAKRIVAIAKDAGMAGLILTCKHHDGFCLWQTTLTNHSIKKSGWMNDTGDVVEEISRACASSGLKFGVYLSPWDRNSKDYGKPEYIKYYRNQLKELLTKYGDISEVWFDGANGGDGYYGGAREKRVIDRRTYYGWSETWSLVRKLQPDAAMFSDVGPDTRWVGNEDGYAGETCWSPYTPIGENNDQAAPGYVLSDSGIEGTENGSLWLPPECDVSIRPGWFYHASEDTSVKSPNRLFDLYLRSVGRNGSLLLNVPPDRRGLISSADSAALIGFKELRTKAFAHNLAAGGTATATNVRGNSAQFSAAQVVDDNKDTYWATDDGVTAGTITIDLEQPTEFNCIVLQEYIALGQRVKSFLVEVEDEGKWKTVAQATTIGHKRILVFPKVTSDKVRINILNAKACLAISNLEVYDIPDSILAH